METKKLLAELQEICRGLKFIIRTGNQQHRNRNNLMAYRNFGVIGQTATEEVSEKLDDLCRRWLELWKNPTT